MRNTKTKYLKILLFSQIIFWDVKRYIYDFNFKKENYVYLKEILNQIRIPISKNEIKKKNLNIISKINFSGDLFLREFEEINNYKGNLFFVPNNVITYSKINARHGCIYFNSEKSNPFVVSSEYPVFKLDNKRVLGEYLHLVLRSNQIKEYLNSRVTGISKSRLKVEEFLNVPIPLPSIQTQKSIVNSFYKKLEQSDNFGTYYKNLEKQIDDYLFEVLHIDSQDGEIKNKGLNFTRFNNTIVWGVEKLLNVRKGLLKSKKYKNEKLSDVIEINPPTNLSDLKENDSMSFIPMVSVSDYYGEISNPKGGIKSKIKGYTKFKENDLIWARITPCMQNGKSAIAKNLVNGYGYGSTEFHVLRQKNTNVTIEYIYHLLRTKIIRKDAMRHFTGSAGQQRVPKSYLENLFIPIPPHEIQRKIVAKLNNLKNEMKSLRKKAEEYRNLAISEFEQELFN